MGEKITSRQQCEDALTIIGGDFVMQKYDWNGKGSNWNGKDTTPYGCVVNMNYPLSYYANNTQLTMTMEDLNKRYNEPIYTEICFGVDTCRPLSNGRSIACMGVKGV